MFRSIIWGASYWFRVHSLILTIKTQTKMKTIKIEKTNRVALDVVLNNYIKAMIIDPKRVVFSCLSGFAMPFKKELIAVFGKDYVEGDEFIRVTLPPHFTMEQNKTSITFYKRVYQLEVKCK